MPAHSDLGIRMKTYYEQAAQTKLIRRMPVAIRIDGKAFHTFTKGFKRPYDKKLSISMQETMQYLCENIQGCVLGYTQSDEITLILIDYQQLNTSAWFNYDVQKMCSVAASMATMNFNKVFTLHAFPLNDSEDPFLKKYYDTLRVSVFNGAMFDARCFNIPKEEVTNLIYWRQLDAIRNSIQTLGLTYFSHRELQHKSCEDIKTMLLQEKNIDWEKYPTSFKRGSCCIKEEVTGIFGIKDIISYRRYWKIDNEIPIFKGKDREYIDKLVDF